MSKEATQIAEDTRQLERGLDVHDLCMLLGLRPSDMLACEFERVLFVIRDEQSALHRLQRPEGRAREEEEERHRERLCALSPTYIKPIAEEIFPHLRSAHCLPLRICYLALCSRVALYKRTPIIRISPFVSARR